MIEISEKSKSKLEELVGEYYVLTDFDRTITAIDSESSWGILSKSHCAPEEYVKERQRLYDYYRPIEIDLTLDYKEKNRLMNEWWTKHINLLTKYKLKESIIDQVVTDDKMMKFRKGAREFLEKLHQYNIPVIIISAGIGNFIKKFLIFKANTSHCYFI